MLYPTLLMLRRVIGQHHPQRAVGAKHLLLPDHLAQTFGAQPVGQGLHPGGRRGGPGTGVKQVSHQKRKRKVKGRP